MKTHDGKLKRFGRYILFDHLVDGGMAKIFRARFLSEDVDRIVAIKMISPQYSRDEEFKRMFLDEIKVAFALGHPNIAQIFEYGFHEDQLYTSMEFVDGKNLKEFLTALKAQKCIFPVDVSVYIASKVCEALHYAHNFRDKLSGKKLNIVHRDVSPHNIMMAFDGSVKVIDFGIAKSDMNSESTQIGTIKGKLSYLAPEYLEGHKLDHCYDQFALGVTLWELLCSRKLFEDTNSAAIIKKIQLCKVPPPSHINPNVSSNLDKIIMKSLARDPKMRYDDMNQFNRELVKFLYSHYPDFNPLDLSSFSKALFKKHIERDRAKLFEFGKIDISPYLQDLEEDSKSDKKDKTKSEIIGEKFYLCDVKDIGNQGQDFNLEFNKDDDFEKGNTEVGFNERRFLAMKKEKEAREEIENEIASKAKQRKKMIRTVAVLILLWGVYSERERILGHELVKEHLSTAVPSLYPSANKGKRTPSSSVSKDNGKLKFKGFKSSYKLFINGKRVEHSFFSIRLPLGKKYKIKVTDRGKKPFIREFFLSEENPEVLYEIPELPLAFFGEIYSSSSENIPPGTILKLEAEGEPVHITVPITSYSLPSGSYRAKLVNERFGIDKDIDFIVEEGKRIEVYLD
ncbi:MAG: serine/threonine-protein kinase [Bacteriovoracales bacterium]|nr:serine/threonine-protein kinase [Bacteriovoracales bacterium]